MLDAQPGKHRKGIALPLVKEGTGYFAPKTGHVLAWSAVAIATAVPMGTRPMRRQRGSGLNNLLFSSAGTNDAVVEIVVRDAVRTQVPYVYVTNVRTQKNDRKTNVYVEIALAGEQVTGIPVRPPVSIPASARN